MTRFTTLFAILLVLSSTIHSQEVVLPKKKSFEPFEAGDLATRYPAGKKWRSVSTFQATGTGRSTNWGLTGEQNITIINRYSTVVEILDNRKIADTVTIKMRVDIEDAAQTSVISNTSLRLADLETDDPLLLLAMDKGVDLLSSAIPPLKILIESGKILEGADPNLKRSLTALARRLNIRPETLAKAKDLELIEKPGTFAGSSFAVDWDNKFGITKVVRTPKPGSGAPQKMDTQLIREWAVGANPLAELYVFPSLSKRRGDKWPLDARDAGPIFAGRGDAITRGEVGLAYVDDQTYAGNQVRHLDIRNGNLNVSVNEGENESRYRVDSMDGKLLVADDDGMLLMGNGNGDVSYNRLSTNHILFKAEISRDFECKWRYEAEKIRK